MTVVCYDANNCKFLLAESLHADGRYHIEIITN
jgi:hypothetical protein